jgi:hypothetical protein
MKSRAGVSPAPPGPPTQVTGSAGILAGVLRSVSDVGKDAGARSLDSLRGAQS